MFKHEKNITQRMLATPPELARTYDLPSYIDPWDLIRDYQRVIEYTGANPNKGSTAVANALNHLRLCIRPWLDGSVPDAVRGIQFAERKDWLK